MSVHESSIKLATADLEKGRAVVPNGSAYEAAGGIARITTEKVITGNPSSLAKIGETEMVEIGANVLADTYLMASTDGRFITAVATNEAIVFALEAGTYVPGSATYVMAWIISPKSL